MTPQSAQKPDRIAVTLDFSRSATGGGGCSTNTVQPETQATGEGAFRPLPGEPHPHGGDIPSIQCQGRASTSVSVEPPRQDPVPVPRCMASGGQSPETARPLRKMGVVRRGWSYVLFSQGPEPDPVVVGLWG